MESVSFSYVESVSRARAYAIEVKESKSPSIRGDTRSLHSGSNSCIAYLCFHVTLGDCNCSRRQTVLSDACKIGFD